MAHPISQALIQLNWPFKLFTRHFWLQLIRFDWMNCSTYLLALCASMRISPKLIDTRSYSLENPIVDLRICRLCAENDKVRFAWTEAEEREAIEHYTMWIDSQHENRTGLFLVTKGNKWCNFAIQRRQSSGAKPAIARNPSIHLAMRKLIRSLQPPSCVGTIAAISAFDFTIVHSIQAKNGTIDDGYFL